MSRFVIRLILIPIVIFTAVLLVIHAQPYDDHQLRALLLPEGCPAPCFMGIRPGVTTEDEAVQMLLATNWVTYQPSKVTADRYLIDFRWSRNQPAFFRTNEILELTILDTGIKKVESIRIWFSNKLSLGNFYLALGHPNRYQANMYAAPSPYAYLIMLNQFENDQMTLNWALECPIKLSRLLQQPHGGILTYHDTLRADVPTLSFADILKYPTCS